MFFDVLNDLNDLNDLKDLNDLNDFKDLNDLFWFPFVGAYLRSFSGHFLVIPPVFTWHLFLYTFRKYTLNCFLIHRPASEFRRRKIWSENFH